jgi:hypothetical protein
MQVTLLQQLRRISVIGLESVHYHPSQFCTVVGQLHVVWVEPWTGQEVPGEAVRTACTSCFRVTCIPEEQGSKLGCSTEYSVRRRLEVFLLRWKCVLWSPGSWHSVALTVVNIVSKEHSGRHWFKSPGDQNPNSMKDFVFSFRCSM